MKVRRHLDGKPGVIFELTCGIRRFRYAFPTEDAFYLLRDSTFKGTIPFPDFAVTVTIVGGKKKIFVSCTTDEFANAFFKTCLERKLI